MNSKEIDKEIEILQMMNECKNSVKYIDRIFENNNIYIVTEKCDSNLREELNKHKNGFKIKEIKNIVSQINIAFKFLRDKNYFHRDIKPENILINKIDNNIICKLCDYGLSKDNKELDENSDIIIAGTPLYMAPEITREKYSITSDLFSIGILLYELYYGNSELKLTQKTILENIKNGLKKKNKDDNDEEFEQLKSLIEKLTLEKEDRINWKDYFANDFFKIENNEISSIRNNPENKKETTEKNDNKREENLDNEMKEFQFGSDDKFKEFITNNKNEQNVKESEECKINFKLLDKKIKKEFDENKKSKINIK